MELVKLKKELSEYEVIYRSKLSHDVSFGIELEFLGIDLDVLFHEKYNTSIDEWKSMSDYTLTKNNIGGELVSPVLGNNSKSFSEIMDACLMIKKLGGKQSLDTGGHIHVGSHILGDDYNNWVNLLKIWSAFENVMVEFAAGDKKKLRNSYDFYAVPYTKYKNFILNNTERMECFEDFRYFIDSFEVDKAMDFSKNSFLDERKYEYTSNKFEVGNTVEFRLFNSSFSHLVWQNNINFVSYLMNYVVSSNYDSELIDYKLGNSDNNHYKNFIVEDAILLSNLLFLEDCDKIGFLKQCFHLPLSGKRKTKFR